MAASKVTFRDHGQMMIEGDFVIEDSKGNTFDLSGRTKISLCRCGHSRNKPFCDGSHHGRSDPSEKFNSEIEACKLPEMKVKKDPA